MIDAALAAGSMIPFFGWASTGGKYTKKILKLGEDLKINKLNRTDLKKSPEFQKLKKVEQDKILKMKDDCHDAHESHI